uniref:Omega-Liphistoxin-Lsp1a_1 n=1 Tax=Liphistius sp. SGP-2016 TaxID=1905180 RepID=A0A4Q8K806_9ARAC
MNMKILVLVAVLCLVVSTHAERHSKTDMEDSPMIQERRCLESGKPCSGGTQKIPCCGMCTRNKCT